MADAPGSPAEVTSPPAAPAAHTRSPARYLLAMLLARLFESLPLTCPNCRADIGIIAFVTDAALIERILTHLGEPPRPPSIAPPPVDLPPAGRHGVKSRILCLFSLDPVFSPSEDAIVQDMAVQLGFRNDHFSPRG